MNEKLVKDAVTCTKRLYRESIRCAGSALSRRLLINLQALQDQMKDDEFEAYQKATGG